MNTALISLASNDKDKEQTLINIREKISQDVTILHQTSVYKTIAVGTSHPSEYANALLLIETEDDYDSLRNKFKKYEQQAGRTPLSKQQGIIPLDIDIISWNDVILKKQDLQYEYMKIGLDMLYKTTSL